MTATIEYRMRGDSGLASVGNGPVRMDTYWLEQTADEVPAEDPWLSAKELQCLRTMRFAKRRDDWRLGRWTAKRAVAACLNLPTHLPALANLEIRAAASGAPEVFLFDRRAALTISISHRASTALCAVAPSELRLGCDLELIERRSEAFVADYFTINEQDLVERTAPSERPLLETLLWSAKESALKALAVGLRLPTNCMDVQLVDTLPPECERRRQHVQPIPLLTSDSRYCNPDADGWRCLQVVSKDALVFRGWWRAANRMVRSVVSVVGATRSVVAR